MFNKILIANRGEIACRIIKTARSMGLHSVAIYSSVDKESLHVQLSDSAYYVGLAPAKDSYLNIPQIIKIAQESGAQAIHPGYGFLSENPALVQACEEAGLIFIGPPLKAMQIMASKQLAKQLLEKSSVPLTPGYHGLEQSESSLLAEAKKIGFPLLIKAANGGGGKGIRAVHQEAEFTRSLDGAKRESMASFGCDTVILEKLLVNPRHIEVQIMADHYGSVLSLFERDCSIQRRHQKIIEEAPAPHLSTSLRQNLASAACEVASAIHYRGAGTVEFLVDKEENFYFMEMNTRLQVEHPVTEMITGLDLVSWQLLIANQQPLPLTQEKIQMKGHAIECRIYAEDPFEGFIPSIGQLNFLKEPLYPGIRIDTGVTLASEITQYYDPMISKLIAWGKDREEALQRMQQALSHYFIGGVKTNIPFLQAICKHPQFAQAKLSTDFLNQENLSLMEPDLPLAFLMIISFDYLYTLQKVQDPLLQAAFSWQMQGSGYWIRSYQYKEKKLEARVTPVDNKQFLLKIEDQEQAVRATLTKTCLSIVTVKQSFSVQIANTKQSLTLYTNQGPITILRVPKHQPITQNFLHKGQLTAPMPATVVAVLKKRGDFVKAGESLMVLEAMKMEHTIHAPKDGIIKKVCYPLGAQVSEGSELLLLDCENTDNR